MRAGGRAKVVLAAACLGPVLAGAGCAPGERPRRPSIVLVSIDTLRADHVGCYGYERDTTPRLDALARSGAVFEQHVSNTSWTLPSHASMLTGLPDTLHGVESDDRALDPARTTLAEVLAGEGYRTAGFFSGPYLHPTFGFSQGFETYESAITLRVPKDREEVWHRVNDTDRMRLIERESYQVSTGPELVLRSTAWLDTVAEDEPFFLFLHFFDCHWDYVPPERCWRTFDPDYADPTFDGRQFIANDQVAPDMPAHHLRHLIARYDGEILFTDEMLGRVLDHLDRLGRSTDTLVVVTSDHGEEFFEHGQKGHRNNLFDESLRIPLVLHGKGRVPEGVRVAAQTSIIDVTPTILDLLDVPVPAEMTGRSLVPLLAADPPDDLLRRTAYGRLTVGDAAPRSRFSRTARRKLIATRPPGDGRETLLYFDLDQDPGEQHARVGRSDAPGSALPEVLDAWRRLDETERAERAAAAGMDQHRPGARPDIDAQLRRQLIENGYIRGD